MFTKVEYSTNNNFSISDIVRTINIKDIETYVEQQMYRCQDQYIMSEIDNVIKSKVKNLVDELISQGYEVFNSGDFDSRQELLRNQIEELQKHNKFLQHNVSQLQKQVNKLKQLELIKWLADYKGIEISKHFIDLKNNRVHCVSRRGLQLEESLTELVNLIWQSLSDAEKEEIKRILE